MIIHNENGSLGKISTRLSSIDASLDACTHSRLSIKSEWACAQGWELSGVLHNLKKKTGKRSQRRSLGSDLNEGYFLGGFQYFPEISVFLDIFL